MPAQTQTRNRFVERLERGPVIVGDGGMGALLSAAVPRLRTPEEANLRAPDAVVSLHVSFVNAAAVENGGLLGKEIASNSRGRRLAEGSDRPADEDVATGHLPGVAGELDAGGVDRLQVVLEKVV